MAKIASMIVLAALIAAPTAWADDDPATVVSELTRTAKPKATPLAGIVVTLPKKCLPARSPPSKDVPAPKLLSTYPAKDEVVRPGVLVVRLTFDLPMACRGALSFAPDNPLRPGVQVNPCTTGEAQTMTLSYDRLNLRILCAVEPFTRYVLYINRQSSDDFLGLSGLKAEGYTLTFRTSGGPGVSTVREAVNQDPRFSLATPGA